MTDSRHCDSTLGAGCIRGLCQQGGREEQLLGRNNRAIPYSAPYSQKRASASLELELQVNCQTWVLGTKLRSSGLSRR